VLNSPRGQNTQEPSGLVRRPILNPVPLWTWSLVWRRDEDDAAVLAVVDALTRNLGDLGVIDRSTWLPSADPYWPG
jgi:DNA-binding transcriptional LysR family regulator